MVNDEIEYAVREHERYTTSDNSSRDSRTDCSTLLVLGEHVSGVCRFRERAAN